MAQRRPPVKRGGPGAGDEQRDEGEGEVHLGVDDGPLYDNL